MVGEYLAGSFCRADSKHSRLSTDNPFACEHVSPRLNKSSPFFSSSFFFYVCLDLNVNINSAKKTRADRIERLAPADTYRRFVVSSVWHVEPCLLSHSLSTYIFPQPSLSLSPFSLFVITRKNMDEANGKMRSKHEDVDATSLSADILNPFVHRLELDTTYDKLKVSSSANLPARGNIPRDRCSRVRLECFRNCWGRGGEFMTVATTVRFSATTPCHTPVFKKTNLNARSTHKNRIDFCRCGKIYFNAAYQRSCSMQCIFLFLKYYNMNSYVKFESPS